MRSKSLALVPTMLGVALLALDVRADEASPTPVSDQPKESPATKSVTLEEAVRRALSRNPDAEVAARDVDRAEGLMKQVRAGWLPTLDATGTYTRLDADRVQSSKVRFVKRGPRFGSPSSRCGARTKRSLRRAKQ